MATLGLSSLALGAFNAYNGRQDWKTTAGYLGLMTPITTLVRWQDILEGNKKMPRPYTLPHLFGATVFTSAFLHGGLVCAGRFIGNAAKPNQ